MRIVCFPHAGAGASSFNGWFRHLPDDIELVRVQLPGREDNNERPAFTRMEDLIPELYGQVLPLLDRPLAIYGHSMGALVAFELTRALRRNNCPAPVALLVSGRRAAHKPLRRVLLHVLPEADLSRICARWEGRPATCWSGRSGLNAISRRCAPICSYRTSIVTPTNRG